MLLPPFRRTPWLPSLVAALLLWVPWSSPLAAQASSEILRGRVFSVEREPISGATITVTGLATRTSQTTRSDNRGSWTALFQNPEGDYVVQVRAIGFSPVSFRITRTGIGSVLQADVTLRSHTVTLDTLLVLGQRLTADGGTRGSVGGVETDVLANAIFLLDPSDLLALAMQTPGLFAVGDSAFSVLGAGTDQNATTVDGMNFAGGNLPQDAVGSARVITSSADPARGGFSGGLTATTLRGGTDIFTANLRGTGADPRLAWSDPAWPQQVPRNLALSGSVGGPFKKGKLFYLASWNVNNTTSGVYTLLDPQEAILSQSGITLDTVNALRSLLSDLGVPTTGAGIPGSRRNDRFSASLTTDWRPTAQSTVRFAWNGNFGTSGGSGLSAQSFPSSASRSSNDFQFYSMRASTFFKGLLNETSISLNIGQFETNPYLQLPSASVRVGTVFEEDRTGLGSLRFGGGGGLSMSEDNRLDAQHEISWLSPSGNHKVKVGGSYGAEWGTSFFGSNPWGTYSYQSLNDLAAGRVNTFSRQVSVTERDTRGANSAAWIGDEWRVSSAIQLQLGLRIDAAHPKLLPEYNPVIDDLYGLRTDLVPRNVGFVPRLGFSWVSKARQGGPQRGGGGPQIQLPPGMSLSDLPPEMIQMAMGGLPSQTPGYSLTGSIGGYRGVVPTSRIAGMIDATGLPNTRRVLTCIGDAAPLPTWNDFNALPPEECLDGTAPETFSVNQPSVNVFDPSFRPPVSWRGTVNFDGLRPLGWRLGLSGALSWGVNLESVLDENLRRDGGFTLNAEDDRPIYVDPSQIVPSTGAIAPGASRVNPQFGAVSRTVSDLRNRTAQLTATLAPPRPLLRGKFNPSLTYVYTNSRAEQRGFGGGGGDFGGFSVRAVEGGFATFGGGFGGGGGTTAGDPATKEWVGGSQPQHQFVVTLGTRLWWFNFNLRANILSGVPFTPVVAGDINGDGRSNDRAFIPNPSTTADPVLASQLQELLGRTTSGARECLERQFGRVAGANSCRTPWQGRLDLNLNFQPPQNFGWGDRLRITTTLLNASGAMVRVLGLEDTPLGRSAASTQPDPRLLYVTGFDPATQRYTYQVNQVFGEPFDFGNARRRFPPFQLQVGLELKVGGPPTSPMARSMGLLPAGGAPALTADDVQQRLRAIGRNPVPGILAHKDSLALTTKQLAELDSISSNFTVEVDRLLEPVASYVLRKGKGVKDVELNPLLARAQPDITRLVQSTTTAAKGVLTLEQQAKLPEAPRGGPAGMPPGMRMPGGGAPMPVGMPVPSRGP
jgi:hypothetical protein